MALNQVIIGPSLTKCKTKSRTVTEKQNFLRTISEDNFEIILNWLKDFFVTNEPKVFYTLYNQINW